MRNADRCSIQNIALDACDFFVCMIIPGGLWHPMWVVFLAIPVYYSITGSINKALGKSDDDEEEECDCEKD